MNIQIFGIKKCFDTKKAERYFKERGIKFQFIDLKEKSMSKGEFLSVKQAVGGIRPMIDENSKENESIIPILIGGAIFLVVTTTAIIIIIKKRKH